MSFYYLSSKLSELNKEKEQTVEATTIDAISFIPAHLGIVKAKILSLAEEKPEWGIKVLEGEDSRILEIENRLKITVPLEHWDNFLTIFDGKLDNKNYLNLQTILNEEKDEKIKTFFHITNVDNLNLIKKEGLRIGSYITDSFEDARAMQDIMADEHETQGVIIELNLTPTQIDRLTIDQAQLNAYKTHEIIPFGRVIRENLVVKERKFLREAIEDDMKDLRRKLRPALNKMFNKQQFKSLDETINMWKAWFKIYSYKTKEDGGPIISQERKKKDIQSLYGKLLREYGEDKGNLEMLSIDIDNNRMISAFDIFKNYDFLYGTRIQSYQDKIPLIFEAMIDINLDTSQSIYIGDEEVLANIQEQEKMVKRVGNVLYPVGGTFTPKFFRILKDIVEDVVTKSEEAEEK